MQLNSIMAIIKSDFLIPLNLIVQGKRMGNPAIRGNSTKNRGKFPYAILNENVTLAKRSSIVNH
jgi:hypothetical protein